MLEMHGKTAYNKLIFVNFVHVLRIGGQKLLQVVCLHCISSLVVKCFILVEERKVVS